MRGAFGLDRSGCFRHPGEELLDDLLHRLADAGDLRDQRTVIAMVAVALLAVEALAGAKRIEDDHPFAVRAVVGGRLKPGPARNHQMAADGGRLFAGYPR